MSRQDCKAFAREPLGPPPARTAHGDVGLAALIVALGIYVAWLLMPTDAP